MTKSTTDKSKQPEKLPSRAEVTAKLKAALHSPEFRQKMAQATKK